MMILSAYVSIAVQSRPFRLLTSKEKKSVALIGCVISVTFCVIAAVGIKLHLSRSASVDTTSAAATEIMAETESETTAESTTESTTETTTETTIETTTESTTKKLTLNFNVNRIYLSNYGVCYVDKVTLSGTYTGISKINSDLNEIFNKAKEYTVEEDPNNPGYGIYGGDLSIQYVEYELINEWYDNKYISILYKTYENFGGNGGELHYLSRVYNLNTGEKVTIEKFTNKSRGAIIPILKNYISSYIEESDIEYISKTIPEEAAKLLNDSSYEIQYSVDKDNVYILFDKYEIACGADGDFTIPIPKSELI